MNYLITENKLNNIILNFINNYYDVNEINYNPLHDDDGNPTNDAIEYYIGDYLESDEVFRLYNKTYWLKPDDYRIELSPMLMIEDDNFVTNLNSMFGDRWKPIFKDWFEENFGEKVKTIDYY